jgi:two-component system, OmpR family, sensor kinase
VRRARGGRRVVARTDTGPGRRISRIPLRHRLVAGFAATMLVLLTAAGAFVYWRVQFALDRSLNGSLDDAARELAPLVTPAGRLPADSATLARVDGFQVLTPDRRVLGHDTRLGDDPVLGKALLRRALTSPVRADTGDFLPAARRPLRLYAIPVRFAGSTRRLVLVIAAPRAQRDEALRELLLQLTAAGLGILVLTSVVGDLLARAALRPVETYRRRAADIAAGATDLRLDVPVGRDDEITRLGHTLNGMLDALSEALERERRFINDASHELRTPLTLVTSRVQLMLRRPRSVAQHEAALAEITEDLTRLTRMADELLELGSGHEPTGAGIPHDLAAEAADMVRVRGSLAPAGSFYAAPGVVALHAHGPVPVDLDGVAIRRILDNLLDNAALHGSAPVTVTVDRVDGWGRLQVADCGDGMPPDLLATATERFARSPAARSRPGSGLGLSLVATLVTTAGGQLRLCHAGHHHRVGTPVAVACRHDQAMTITVLLPPTAVP